jgi:hypothetical protein
MSSAAVYVSAGSPTVANTPNGQMIEQEVSLANAVANYTLSYHAEHSADGTQVLSDSWGWRQGYVALGMTAPSQPNWYYQAFFNWTFDGESIHSRPATMRVVRGSGASGMIEYSWDTPNASVSIRFAMVTGSDKLLMFGDYTPKGDVAGSELKLVCYPSFFPPPRQRSVTTALGTRQPGETIDLDTEREHWVLYEDTSAGREGAGSAGLVIGTKDAFESITIPVGAYGTITTLTLAPDARRFALALYDFPSMPDYRRTRDYFGRLGDREAAALAEIAAGNLDEPLAPMPVDRQRTAEIQKAGREIFDRPEERWQPDGHPLEFDWAAVLPGEPIATAVFARRWEAWEAMELNRRLEMAVEHLYWDDEDKLSYPRAWPYASATGIGAIPFGIAARRAAALAADPARELTIIAGLMSAGVPGVVRNTLMEQVAAGKGLLLVGPVGWHADWPPALFAAEDPELAAAIADGFDLETMPGLEVGGLGRVGDLPPILAYRHGRGRVVVLNVNLGGYSCLMPRHALSEGIPAALDRWLGLVARAAAAAAGRPLSVVLTARQDQAGRLTVATAPAQTAGALQLRVRDDLGRTLMDRTAPWPQAQAGVDLPVLPPSRSCTVDLCFRDADGQAIGLGSARLQSHPAPQLEEPAVAPSTRTNPPAPLRVDLPDGGTLECSITVQTDRALDDATLTWEVRDAFDRLLAGASSAAPVNGGRVVQTLTVPKPVTVCHILTVSLAEDNTELDFAHERFTMTVPYPYDDFTALMWNTASTSPVLLHTDRLCYQWGADMCDPANTLRADDAQAALQYALRARSGMRMVPYVTRIYANAPVDNQRRPSLSDPEYLAEWDRWLTIQGRQAAPYQPAAYTLGDENFLYRGPGEIGHHPAAIAAFREWLQAKYRTIAALNRTWESDYAGFDDITPMLLSDAAARLGADSAASSLAPWIDHKVFLDDCFAYTHNRFRSVLRAQDPGAKVGWDGILGYGWQSGYDFVKLTAECDLNQTYLRRWLQGRLVADFKKPDALTGAWGNRVADNEEGWHAFPWACLFRGDNSTWWWTSWGCDYVPFYPDLSQSNYGKWFFEAVRETTAGPGRLIVQSRRAPSPVAVLYSKRNMFAWTLAEQVVENQPWAGDVGFRSEHEAMLRAVFDLGYDPTHISEAQLAEGLDPARIRVLFLPLSACLSTDEADALRQYVEAGGTLVVDGRAGLLTGNGAFHAQRPLDDVLGVSAPAGVQGFTAESQTGTLTVSGAVHGVADDIGLDLEPFAVNVIEPGLQVNGGTALAQVGETPALVVNRFGRGVAVTLNIMLKEAETHRVTDEPKPRRQILEAILHSAGVLPQVAVTLADGRRPLVTHQFGFRNGNAQYLAIQQDILIRGIEPQPATISLPQPAIVYDVRAGKRVGTGRVRQWDVTLTRGNPLLYALLPYEVTAVELRAPQGAARGRNAAVAATVTAADAVPGYHVVRVDVFAPDAEEPHRQYSQNMDCPAGRGTITIPFALNDPPGTWRLVARDVASGTTSEVRVQVQ